MIEDKALLPEAGCYILGAAASLSLSNQTAVMGLDLVPL